MFKLGGAKREVQCYPSQTTLTSQNIMTTCLICLSVIYATVAPSVNPDQAGQPALPSSIGENGHQNLVTGLWTDPP